MQAKAERMPSRSHPREEIQALSAIAAAIVALRHVFEASMATAAASGRAPSSALHMPL
jgi:peptidoglycan/LPS O-acetylase OafA/YrhL